MNMLNEKSALQVAADHLGATIEELEKLIKAKEISASSFLPGLIEELEKEYQAAIEKDQSNRETLSD